MRTPSLRALAFGLIIVAAAIVALMWRARRGDQAAAVIQAPPMVAAPEPPPVAPPPPIVPPILPPAAVVDAAAGKPAPRTTTAPRSSEPQLMVMLRILSQKDPAAAIELAREGNRRFPDSPDAPERASILVHALAALDRPSEARGEAEEMVNHYPDSNWVREVERFIGAHRHRNVRLNDAGELIAE